MPKRNKFGEPFVIYYKLWVQKILKEMRLDDGVYFADQDKGS